MTDPCLIIGLIVIIGITASALLGARDSRQRRLLEEKRPIADRIRDIREDAAFMNQQLQRLSEQQWSDSQKGLGWISPVIEYYRRLEELSSVANASPEEALILAEEARHYVIEHRLKGIRVGMQARKLAVLLERRDSTESSSASGLDGG